VADDDEQDAGPELTRADFDRLEARLGELAEAQEEPRAARTPGTRQESREDVADAEDAFTRAAKAAGLDRAQIVQAVQAAKEEAQYDGFKKMMDRWVGEQVDDEEEGKPKKPARKRSQGKPDSSQAGQSNGGPEPDSAPVKPHWSERSLSDMLR